VRGETYARYAWPRSFAKLYADNGLTVAVALALGLAMFLTLAVALHGSLIHVPLQGKFYAVFPHRLMALMFGAVSFWVVAAIALGVERFWHDSAAPPITRPAVQQTGINVLAMTYLDGCTNDSDAGTPWRRRMHHLTAYGFALCFASTTVGTIYHYGFGWIAPYALTSLPVLLGTVGGAMLTIGTAGLAWLAHRRHPQHRLAAQRGMDMGFIALLFLTATTGLALLAFRDSRFLALWLAIHLGVVMALFLTLPYGKFVHGFYRVAALLKFQIERRLPSKLKLGGD
jgi:citrate/tricarballylate utilization protein